MLFMVAKTLSQNQAILDYLKSGNTLTPIEALEKFHCFRLAARISDLRKSGHTILNDGQSNYAKYRLLLPQSQLELL
jgi:hypothetical protein